MCRNILENSKSGHTENYCETCQIGMRDEDKVVFVDKVVVYF